MQNFFNLKMYFVIFGLQIGKVNIKHRWGDTK